MHRLFFGIYGSVLLAIFLLLALSYMSFSSINEYRYKQYLASFMSGTMELISTGASRQEQQDREKWLSLVSSLMGVKITLVESQTKPSAVITRRLDAQQQQSYLLHRQIDQQQAIQVELSSVTEQLTSATAFLILNELGRFPAQQRQEEFERLRQTFSFEINRVPLAPQNFDSEQRDRLSRGETLVVWQTELGRNLSLDVYAPWGSSDDLLKLGPIRFFDPFPTWLLLIGLFIALAFLALWVMRIIRNLARQLKQLQQQVDDIEPEYMDQSHPQQGQDLVSQLQWKIESMSKRIERLLSQKSYMIRAVSHDLRTPLSKAQFRLENLSILLGEDNAMLQATKQNLGQLNLMIDELLSYETLSQQDSIRFESVDIIALTQQISADIQIVFGNCQFHCVSEHASCFADINPPLFTRMLENLLNNAGRYCQHKVLLKVQVQASKNTVAIHIIDDGQGIATSEREAIFEPFFQVEQSRNNSKANYGLGLAIVKQIVLQHQGSIKLADSTNGAHFIIQLPMLQGDHNA